MQTLETRGAFPRVGAYDSEWAAKTTQGIFKARDKHVVECVDWCKSLLA
eukprot:COSAG06_NODE_8434_length_2175_cov_1.585742_1_plen_48_part_10